MESSAERLQPMIINQYLTINAMRSGSYMERTRHNATSSDFTVACALDFTTAGERFTKKVAGDKYIALKLDEQTIPSARILYRALVDNHAKVLNLAGNGIHSLTKKEVSQRQVNLWIHDVLVLVHAHYPLQGLKSGGQTGVDIAAAVVGPLLHIPTEINFPQGYMQRGESGVDFMQPLEKVQRAIEKMRSQLIEDLQVTS